MAHRGNWAQTDTGTASHWENISVLGWENILVLHCVNNEDFSGINIHIFGSENVPVSA